MPVFPLPITRVRVRDVEADALLANFIHGSRRSGRRPPRGVDPAHVTKWIIANVQPETDASTMMRVGDTARFYESTGILDHLKSFLTRKEADGDAFGRSLQVLQVLGDIGSAEDATFAAGYFKDVLLPQPFVMDNFGLVLETAEALAPVVDLPAIERRVQSAIDAARKVGNLDGAAGLPYRKYSDLRRNNYPNAVLAIEGKRHLARAEPAQRLPDLVRVYLGETALSGLAMEVWSGRLIRAHASNAERHAAVIKAFASAIDGALSGKADKSRRDFAVHRSAQAIVYLQGELTPAQAAAYRALATGPLNFLNDDD